MVRRKLPWGRIIAGIVTSAVLAVGIWALVACVESGRDLAAARIAEPIHLQVDLSKPGEYVGHFRQTFDMSHGEELFIQTDRPPDFYEEESLLKGLRGRLVITTPQGETVLEQKIEEGSSYPFEVSHEPEGFVPLVYFRPFPEGEYELKLTVEQGAPLLASLPHALVARYRLCGLETMPVALTGLTAFACLLVAGLLTAGIVCVTIKKAKAARTPTA